MQAYRGNRDSLRLGVAEESGNRDLPLMLGPDTMTVGQQDDLVENPKSTALPDAGRFCLYYQPQGGI